MTKPKIIKILNIGLVTAVLVSALSFFIKLVPCKFNTAKVTGFGLCKLPSIFENIPELSNNYYGISNNPLAGLVLQFVLAIIIIVVVLSLFKRKTSKILDLTNKRAKLQNHKY